MPSAVFAKVFPVDSDKFVANYLFGGFPESASLDKAIFLMERAVKNRPDYLLYRFDLAKAYKANRDNEKAIKQLKKVLDLPVVTPDDSSIKEDVRTLINEL